MPWYRVQVEREISAVRSYTLWRASNCVLGRGASSWLDPHDVLWRERRSYIGTLDDEKLLAVLSELDAVRAELLTRG